MKSTDTVAAVRATEMKQTAASKKWLISTAIKCSVSGALIYWLLQGTNLAEIFMAARSADISLLVVAYSLHFVGYYVRAHRWRVLLKAQGVDASILFLIKSYMVCAFFSNFLPSTIGGDAVRAYDSWRIGKSKVGGVAVVFVDRFLGLFALMLFALSALFVSEKLTVDLPFLDLWILLGMAGILLIVWMIFMPSRQMSVLITKLRLPFSRTLQGVLDYALKAFQAFRGRKDALMSALGLSLILQTNVVVYYYLIARALDFPVPLQPFFLIIPLAIFVMMVPVSLNAIGIRESAFVFFFSTFGVLRSEAIAFAWLAYGIVIFHGLFGGIVYGLRSEGSGVNHKVLHRKKDTNHRPV